MSVLAFPLARTRPRAARLYPLILGLVALFSVPGAPRAATLPPGSGELVLRGPDDAAPVEAPRLMTDVTVDVSGPTARAVVTQAFRNTTKEWVEGTYVYPLPEDAAVDSMKLVIGDRIVVADIRERAQAKRDYEAAKSEGKTAALTEQERPNVFTNAVANIGPGETVLVRIEYQQTVRHSGDRYSLRVPLVVAPRYNPAPPIVNLVGEDPATGGADPVPDRDRITPPVLDPSTHAPVNPVTVHVSLKAGFDLGALRSDTHKVKIEETGPQSRTISLADGPVPADSDFELVWKPAPSVTPTVGLFREHVGDRDYVLAAVTPPEGKAGPRLPRDVTFVIDNSGSMGGTSIRQAKAGLLAALDRLGPSDRFNVIRFDHTMDSVFPATVPADQANLDRAKAYVAALEANGGTEMLAPLQAALKDSNPEDTKSIRQVVFLTDGAIGNEDQIFSAIAAGRGRSRLFMVGIGSAPNGHLMQHAAELGRGSYTNISTIDQVAERTRELFSKLESPVVTDITATFSEGGADVTPDLLPDLYRGEPLVLSAKLPKANGTLTLSGRIGDKTWTQTLDLSSAPEGAGISKAWARAKIGDAETARITGKMNAETADAAILKLALGHKLMTRLTSLVAIDATPRRPAGARLTSAELPLNLPAGWDFEKVFGPAGERAAPIAPPPVQRRAELRKAVAPGVALPQTATDFEIRVWLGLTLLGLGLLVARTRRFA
ncbi:marine proteobacterial sortase target protein [Methylobacterium sp. C25]|uniref:marine proteobacterial sortase target protein n=1 Tax=Methylobacterium sp. C25 TaxID=2721622 RepID=UPI001F1BDE55|nr:marine proteobacterial sortase target protein [Methylobacterium sp. C25]MCE4226408.1 marine proteobacterial sortase target protein [Methylobacterium sp. C25]